MGASSSPATTQAEVGASPEEAPKARTHIGNFQEHVSALSLLSFLLCGLTHFHTTQNVKLWEEEQRNTAIGAGKDSDSDCGCDKKNIKGFMGNEVEQWEKEMQGGDGDDEDSE